jgi:hypothetical protein
LVVNKFLGVLASIVSFFILGLRHSDRSFMSFLKVNTRLTVFGRRNIFAEVFILELFVLNIKKLSLQFWF